MALSKPYCRSVRNTLAVMSFFLTVALPFSAQAANIFSCLKVLFPQSELGANEFDGRLKVPPQVRQQIQNLKQALLDLSKKEDYYGRAVSLTHNQCHGASKYFKRVLKSVGIDTVIVTYEPTNGGWEHSYLIVPDYFGPQVPLIIDPTIKQFMPRKLHNKVHDIFAGSPDELLHFVRKYDVTGIGDSRTPDEAYQLYMQARVTGRFD